MVYGDIASKNPVAISRSRTGALPFCISATAWVDLLGYGSMISDAELKPIAPRTKGAVTGFELFTGSSQSTE